MRGRRLRPDEERLWALVARTVSPAPGMTTPDPPAAEPAAPPRLPVRPPPPLFTRRAPRREPSAPTAAPAPSAAPPQPRPAEAIEPNWKRRIARAREPIAARLDLHGLDQDRARAALVAFLRAAYANDARAVLVITGKGRAGDGVLRQRAPEWLADPAVRGLIAGVSPAERRHGGEGAIYVALKRKA